LLPDLIVAAGRAVAAASSNDQQAALAQASLVYQLACAILMKFSDAVIAWHAADRAVVSAERCGDPVIVSAATRLLAHALLASGQPRAAADLATAAAARLQGPLRQAGGDGLSVYGMLFLKAAVASAEAGDGAAVADMLTEAAEAARLLGSDANRMWTGFGPVNCHVHRVSTHVQLGNGPAAVAAAGRIDPAALGSLPRERRAAHLVDVARGHALAGQRDQATETLLAAERLAAQEVHCRPHASELVTTLVRQSVPAPSARLHGLARRTGAAP
jgi:hypothetical protein